MLPPGERSSLQRSITLSILLLGLLSGTFGLGYSYWHAKQALRHTIGMYFQELARHSADKLSLILVNEVNWVKRLSVFPDVRNAVMRGDQLSLNRPELQEWRQKQHLYFRSLALIDHEGRLTGGITSERTQGYYTRQPWWPLVFEDGKSWVSDIQIGPMGKGFWEVVVPITDEDKIIVGALKVSVETATLFSPALRLRIGKTGNIMLVGANGKVLLCPVLPATRHTRIEGLGDQMKGVKAKWIEVQDDGHGKQGGIIGVSPIRLAPLIVQEQPWQVVVRQDPQETFASVYSLMWKLGAFWVGATVFLALVGSRLTHRIIQPLYALIARVPRLGKEQTAPPLKVEGPQEIQTLSDSFNKLTNRLQAAKQETQQYIQQLEQVNRELLNSENHYRTLWDHAVDSMLIVDAYGMIRDMNRRAKLTLGRSAKQMVGTASATLVVEDDRIHFAQCIKQVFNTGKEQTGDQVHVQLPTGSLLTMEIALVPMVMAGSTMVVLIQLTDVTEKQFLEQQLLRSERLASLSQFASMFAHDIRNPLAGIKKTLELLSDRPELSRGPVRQLVSDLQFTTDLLLGMINDMLDVYQESYSGIPLTISRFPIEPLLQEVVHLFKGECEAMGVTIKVVGPRDSPLVPSDRRRLQRVLINLIHNALKYSPMGGSITLSVWCRENHPTEVDTVGPPSTEIMITVEDEGTGVDPADLPNLFEMFFRKKDGMDLRIGRGLGLHFCKLVIEAHQGRIWVENQENGGARFCVTLPGERSECIDADQAPDRRRSTSFPTKFAASA